MSSPPDGLPTYRLLTGPDDAAFCHRVSDALALGYRLHGSPAATFNGQTVIVAQALVWAPAGRGPARAGHLIYALDLARLSACYQALLDMRVLLADSEHHVLQSADAQLVLHAIPPSIAAGIHIATPPLAREDTAIKPFFTVASLAAAEATLQKLGGRWAAGEWQGPGFRCRNAVDPEGNIIQLREPLA
jgi:predicted enzyme related to lactoylglutathione lyase